MKIAAYCIVLLLLLSELVARSQLPQVFCNTVIKSASLCQIK